MLRSRVGQDKSVGQMDISSKVKNSRWVSNLAVGVLCEADGRLVLLEEATDREAEARVADTLILVAVGALEREKDHLVYQVWRPCVLMRSVPPFDENDTAACFVDCTETRETESG